MLPFVLVFIFAQSAVCLPVVDVNFYEISDAPVIPDTDQYINRNVTTGVLDLIDGGVTPLYVQILINSINDLASLADESSQAVAALQVISVVGELASGYPGDSCQTAAFINSSGGDRGDFRAALTRYIQRFNKYIDEIVELIINPEAVRYSVGSYGNCLGRGRIYRFEDAWDRILGQPHVDYSLRVPNKSALLNEEYCAVHRLYSAFNARSNNVAAAVTAVSLPEVEQVGRLALAELSEFIRTVAYGGNPVPSARALKNALLKTLPQIDC